nr:threonine synthase [Desulfobulbaceae bacterium]
MKYISTRGKIDPIGFKEAVLMGLARDGGLLLPEIIPVINDETIARWQNLSYQELAFEVIALFADDIPRDKLQSIIDRSYSTFQHPEITPLVKKGGVYILELFHGPTLAFKDVALQFLGNIFEYLLAESNSYMNILGATSGDTGSAAIYGVRGKERINIFILHPHKRVSPIQELQMTSVLDDNVFNIAIEGTFDDGQAIVKTIFNDIDFKDQYCLGAVNSINWARILAQVVYYIYAYFKVVGLEGAKPVDFAVPTGNFGDIFAGYVARTMLGVERIGRLVLATNDNDILARFINNGDYSTNTVVQTTSPSMDIQLASNFERYLYYLLDKDSARVAVAMHSLELTSVLDIPNDLTMKIKNDFAAQSVSEDEVTEVIRKFYTENQYLLDPHTAVGVKAGIDAMTPGRPMVCLSTAHPGKFGDAVKTAVGEQELPPALSSLIGRETRCEVLPADKSTIQQFIRDKVARA